MSGFREDIQAAIPALRRYARALTREREAADDLVQDTLVRALRSEHLFHGGEIRNWLFTILINLNRNRLRTLSRRPQYAPLEDADAPEAAAAGVSSLSSAGAGVRSSNGKGARTSARPQASGGEAAAGDLEDLPF